MLPKLCTYSNTRLRTSVCSSLFLQTRNILANEILTT